jgi:hypothetical protein
VNQHTEQHPARNQRREAQKAQFGGQGRSLPDQRRRAYPDQAHQPYQEHQRQPDFARAVCHRRAQRQPCRTQQTCLVEERDEQPNLRRRYQQSRRPFRRRNAQVAVQQRERKRRQQPHCHRRTPQQALGNP